MKCPICGETYLQKRNFCVLCGADLKSAAETEQAVSAPVTEAFPAPSPIKKPVTAEDFFGPSRPIRRTAKMNDLSVSDVDLGDLADANLQKPLHQRYMKSAAEFGVDMTNTVQNRRAATVGMYEAAPDPARTQAAHVPVKSAIGMAEAVGCDQSNVSGGKTAPAVTMSDDIRPVEALPKAQPKQLDEIDSLPVPDCFRRRRSAPVSLEIPNLECC